MKKLRRILLCLLAASLAVGWYLGYRAVNKWYEPLIRPDITVTYDMGEIVPIGPEPNVLHPDELDGYCYRVNSSQIVDTVAYLTENSLEDPWGGDWSIKPEKLLLVSVTVINDGNLKNDFNLFTLGVKGAMENADLANAINPELKGNTLSLALGEEATVTIPFELKKLTFSFRSWRRIEEYPFYLFCNTRNEDREDRIVPLT